MDMITILSEAAAVSGCTQWGPIKTTDLNFYPEIRRICEGNSCRGYGRTWACPPAVGTLEECKDRVLKYRNIFLFSQKFQLEDSFDFEGMEQGMRD